VSRLGRRDGVRRGLALRLERLELRAAVEERQRRRATFTKGAARAKRRPGVDFERGSTFGGSKFHPAVFDFPTDTEGGVTGFHDINPRVGAIYDLFGDGKTSVKFNAGRYTDSASSDGRWTLGNPLSRIQTTVGRSWNDANTNFTPDCDLLNPAAQDLRASGGDQCGAWNNNTFGTEVFSTTYDPDMFKGWYTRPTPECTRVGPRDRPGSRSASRHEPI